MFLRSLQVLLGYSGAEGQGGLLLVFFFFIEYKIIDQEKRLSLVQYASIPALSIQN